MLNRGKLLGQKQPSLPQAYSQPPAMSGLLLTQGFALSTLSLSSEGRSPTDHICFPFPLLSHTSNYKQTAEQKDSKRLDKCMMGDSE